MFDLQVPPEPVQDPPVAEVVQAAPVWDLTVGLIKATVQLDQPINATERKVGTAFLINAPTPDGKPRTVLVTAAHVLDGMPSAQARIGW
ncbi:MAG TPA: serine protease, partial [Brevundimonas sp.]|nr:serine protease [Brevundimonas sp.]